ncbi:general transcription factor 3C polypeptide 5 [Diabrotica virgifera virgifera]|uniref:General transcription factor 3C polypeptide 5 n=1 Tax=Diabrotica virgifera virgifera TaxID=50390 RepID=A0A6P7FGQ6_DIAVI|nr:general transcription factor 3C polypeptide 5 [Diabrotica virgifera virgifera]
MEESTSRNLTAVDKSFVYKLPRKLVRIEYPGLVKNVSNAIETVGGIDSIETAIVDERKKLELRFHPDNKYNKPCTSDRYDNPSLLIKVKEKDGQYDYEIIGYTATNFKFNRTVDFQYLPIVQDDKTGSTEFIYYDIMPKKLADLEYFTSKEAVNQPLFLLPHNFCRYDITHQTLYLKADEKFNLDVPSANTNTMFKMFEPKKKDNPSSKQLSYIVSFTDPNLEIPQGPKEPIFKIVQERCLEEIYEKIKQLFDERPMWTKAAIQHKIGFTNEMSKILLPANAYLWSTGPWRMIWTRLGYDPRVDLSSRIYQILDFRIRESEGTKIMVRAKRAAYRKDILHPKMDESHYILRPDTIPPARQMFYQFCDVLLPEIQEMMQRLPKAQAKLDVKNGWLPVNFLDQCREIANKYVMKNVHQQLVAYSLKTAQGQQDKEESEEDDEDNPVAYSSRMLSQMKIGFKRSFGGAQVEEHHGTVVLSSDDDSDAEMEQTELPAQLPDEEQLSDNSEMELDMEALEEINQMISQTKKDEKINK